MTAKFTRDGLNLTFQLLNYVRESSVQETELLSEVRAETGEMEMGRMMISPEQGQIMALFTKIVQAKRIVEVGSFTGYSAIWMAEAMGEGGEFIACDASEEYLAIAKKNWEKAGLLGSVIKPRFGFGADTLQALLDEGMGGTVDLIFVDADKTGYENYYQLSYELLRPGGVILFDNTLWSGSVADPEDQSDDTVALREITKSVTADDRVFSSLLTVGDGLLVAVKL